MDDKKYQSLLKGEKFETICFTLDYIEVLMNAQGFVEKLDYAHALAILYDQAFKNGRADVLERHIAYNYHELDELNDA
jgi:hypothetical protein